MGGKGALEKESIAAALRSEYLMDIYKMFYRSPINAMKAYVSAKDTIPNLIDEIVILPEVLTVTCTNAGVDGGSGDGFQLRDISRLDPSKKYFPPISTLFVGYAGGNALNFTTPAAPWAAFGEIAQKRDEWIAFWTENFAKRIGRAKATLHLHYGLQCLTPNSQNFLLEFDTNMSKVSRVILRDVLDMKLHSEWIQTVMGPRLKANPPPLRDSLADALAGQGLATAAAVEKSAADAKAAAKNDVFAPMGDLLNLPDSIGLNRLLSFEATVPSPITPNKSLLYDSETSHHSYAGDGVT